MTLFVLSFFPVVIDACTAKRLPVFFRLAGEIAAFTYFVNYCQQKFHSQFHCHQLHGDYKLYYYYLEQYYSLRSARAGALSAT